MASCIANRACYRPWHLIEYDHGCYADDDYAQAQDDFAEATANARLIAAAPKLHHATLCLLEQLESAHAEAFSGCDGSCSYHEAMGIARDALAKARGEQVPA